MKVKPAVKWAGGKRKLFPQIKKMLPNNFKNYYEPFLGGGAVFIGLFGNENESSFLTKEKRKIVLSDLNQDLILTYQVIRDNPAKLLKRLEEHQVKDSKKYFYFMRNIEIKNMGKEKKKIFLAGRFIYLMQSCFNGLYRTDKKGKFNTPYATLPEGKKRFLYNKDNINALSKLLKKTTIKKTSYENIEIEKNSFVYCDPPYPASEVQYGSNFNEDDQKKLKSWVDEITKSNTKIMVSNKNTPFIRNLWNDYKITNLEVYWAIAADGNNRKKTAEVLITNY